MLIKKVHSSFNAATINAHSSDFKTPVCCTLIKIFLILAFTTSLSAQIKDIGTPTTSRSDWKFLGLEKEMITAIAVDWSNPEIIYAGSGSNFSAGTVGGIFKSINGGADWDTLMRGVTVRDLDIHPQNSNIIYAALGVNCLTPSAIIKTIDAGNTWVRADSGIILFGCEVGPTTLVINFVHPEILYAGTAGFGGGGPYKSTDEGRTWFSLQIPGSITSIAIDPNNTNHLYFGTEMSGDIFETKDGGISWGITGLTEKGIIYDIQVNKNSPEKLYAGTAKYGFFMSTDSGESWTQNNNGLPEPIYVGKIQVLSQANLTNIYVTNYFGIYQLVDYSYWEKIGIYSNSIFTIAIFNDKIYAGSSGIYVSGIVNSINDTFYIPSSINLFQNYPNPFNSETKIVYDIDREANVTIEVFDILGRKMKTLVNERKPQGRYTAIWDGTDDKGKHVSTGIYICRLRTAYEVKKMKMLHLK